MEIVLDFGLFELLGVLTLAGLVRNPGAKRRLRLALHTARAKLGRCMQCMTAVGAAVISGWAALLWIGPQADRLVRMPVLVVTLAFTALGALHLVAALYRLLEWLERRVSVVAGGCGCSGGSRRHIQREQ